MTNMIDENFKSYGYYDLTNRPNIFNDYIFNEVELTDNDLISLCIVYKTCLNKKRLVNELDPVKLFVNILNNLDKCIEWIKNNFMDFYAIRLADESRKENEFSFSMVLISLGLKEEPLSPEVKKKLFEKKINIEERLKTLLNKTSRSFIRFLLNYYYLKDEFITGYKNILQTYSELAEQSGPSKLSGDEQINDVEIRSLYLTIVP